MENKIVKMNRLMCFALALTACSGARWTEEEIGEVDQSTDLLVGTPATQACDYPQVFGTPAHTGLACPMIRGMRVVEKLLQDPDADAENAFSGFLQIHESAPLTFGDFVVVPTRGGFTDGFHRETDHYGVDVYRWSKGVTNREVDNKLVLAWSAKTDWQPTDGILGSFGTFTNGYVMGFYPAIGNGSLYVPARSGKLNRFDLATGSLIKSINPFAGTSFDGDERTIDINAVAVNTHNGKVYYEVIAFNAASNEFEAPVRGSWLIEVTPSNATRLVPWDQIATPAVGAPQAGDLCDFPFFVTGVTPTSSATLPDRAACGAQRPNFNAPVAINTTNDHVVTYGSSNNADGAAMLIELDASLHPVLGVDTRGHLLNGCGVLAFDGDDSFCSIITDGFTKHVGFDPEYNRPVMLQGDEIMDNAPWIAPNGDVGVGGYNGGFSFGGGFDSRGSSLVFSSTGSIKAINMEFGWEVTPTVWPHDGTFSYVQDRNLYSNFTLGVARYSPSMKLENAGAVPLIETANAIDFLDVNTLVDRDGRRYGVNGDGRVYAFDADGNLVDSVVLPGDDGEPRSMETESGYGARDRAGRAYFSYAGSVYVIDGAGTDNPAPAISRSATRSTFFPKAHRGIVATAR